MKKHLLLTLTVFLLFFVKSHSEIINFKNCKMIPKSKVDKKDQRFIELNKSRNLNISLNTNELTAIKSWNNYQHPSGQLILAGTMKRNIKKFDENQYVSEKFDVKFKSGSKMQIQEIYLLKERKVKKKFWDYKKDLFGNEKIKFNKKSSIFSHEQCAKK